MSTTIKFPYRYKRVDEGVIPDPTIRLEILTRDGWHKTRFLVDSGADTTCLPLEPYAALLGFRPDPEKKIKIGGVEGKGVTAYPGNIKIRIGGKESSLRCYFLRSRIMPLLGRLDFWNEYSILFDNKKEEIVLKPI